MHMLPFHDAIVHDTSLTLCVCSCEFASVVVRVSACVCASACVTTSQVSILPNSGGPRTHSTSDMVYASRTPPSRGNGRYHGRRVGREELMTGLCKQPRQSITTTTTTTRAAAPSQHNTNTHHTHAARMLMLSSHDVCS